MPIPERLGKASASAGEYLELVREVGCQCHSRWAWRAMVLVVAFIALVVVAAVLVWVVWWMWGQ